MAQFEFKCPQCGQMVTADDTMRGTVAECPFCEKGIVVPHAHGTDKTNPPVRLRPVVQSAQQPSPQPDPQQESEFNRMLKGESRRRMKEKILGLLFFLIKAAAVFAIVVGGFSKWHEYKKSGLAAKCEEVDREAAAQKEDFEKRSRQMSDMAKQKIDVAEGKVQEMREQMEKTVNEYKQELSEYKQKLDDAEKKISEYERKAREYERRISENTAYQNRKTVPANYNRQTDVVAENPRPLVRCTRCSGRGNITRKVACKYCGGSGRERVTTTRWVSGDAFRGAREKVNTTMADCTHCLPGDFRGRGSKGYVIETLTCPLCNGKGRIPQD